MGVTDELMEIERRLAHGRGDVYDQVLHPDALVVVPGAVLDKPACVAAMDDSSGWDDTRFDHPRLVETESTATVVYRFAGRRGEMTYVATLASTYVREDTGWRMILHQQTPT